MVDLYGQTHTGVTAAQDLDTDGRLVWTNSYWSHSGSGLGN